MLRVIIFWALDMVAVWLIDITSFLKETMANFGSLNYRECVEKQNDRTNDHL